MVVVTLALALAVVYHQTGTELRSQLDASLRNSANQLGLAMDPGHDDSPATSLDHARRYMAGQAYQNAAALLFVIVPGYGVAASHPELVTIKSKPDPGETLASQLTENAEASRISKPHPGYNTLPGPDIGDLRIYQEPWRIAGGRRVYVASAESLDGVKRAENGVLRSFVLAGGVALVAALLFAYLIGSRISAPLREAAGVAARIDGGDLTPRLVSPPGASRELRVLADAFNHMLDRLGLAFDAQREFVADASHELRTPLTVMRGQLDLLAAANRDASEGSGEPVSPEELARVERLIQSEIARITRLTDDLLLLAQSEQENFIRPEPVALGPFITELWDGLSLTAERRFEVGETAAVTLMADPDRLAQALRNLGGNAIVHTRGPDGLVQIDATVTPDREQVILAVSDDGPGVPPEHRDRVFERFYRTDPARSRARGGAGLGLAIVKAVAEAHGGSVAVGDSAAGGARFEIRLPRGRSTL